MVAAGPGLGDRKQRQPGHSTKGRDSSQTATPQAAAGEEGKGGGHSHQDLEPEAQIRRGPGSASLMAEQLTACSPVAWGQLSREMLTQTRKEVHNGTLDTDTHTWGGLTRHTTKTLPASGQSPSSKSPPKSPGSRLRDGARPLCV